MSASLVGSEMCIRDRLMAAGGRAACASTASRAPPLTPRSAISTRGWRPVSYTHLTLPTICSV
eukprot:6863028-Alexandrium_andersonii.AAC.1